MRMLEEGRPITLSKALLCFMYEKDSSIRFPETSVYGNHRHQRTFFIV